MAVVIFVVQTLTRCLVAILAEPYGLRLTYTPTHPQGPHAPGPIYYVQKPYQQTPLTFKGHPRIPTIERQCTVDAKNVKTLDLS